MNYVYLLRCSDETLYCGWTNDLEKRITAHNSGAGAKYTRSRLPAALVYCEAFEEKSDALKRERQIKKMTRKQKLELIEESGSGNEPAGPLQEQTEQERQIPHRVKGRIGCYSEEKNPK